MTYWTVTILLAVLFAAPGAALILHVPRLASEMARLGYPAYLLPFLGACKIAAAIVVLAPVPRWLKEWAYAGMTIDVLGALVSRAAVGDHGFELVMPALIGGLIALSWSLRPGPAAALAPRAA